ncbi:MAG TPA: AAA family ATPase [Syntrophomonadaceae bacterium]|nr:AAA family ATPase [Syntrophomonadaceae bacterium]
MKAKLIPSIINLADVEPEEVKFLWEPYIPIGKLTLLEGDPGLGKTFLALSICAAISKGWSLPGQDSIGMQVKNVLFMSAEDGLSDTLAPRLERMGADRSKIYCMTGWRKSEDQEQEQAFTLADISVLRIALEKVKPIMVVIDPLQAYIGDIDLHRANETRPVMMRLAQVAEEYECAIMSIRHLSKSEGSKALYRGIGSIDLTAAARSVILVGEEPSGKKAMAHTKSSCAEKGATLNFNIEPEKGLVWTGTSNCTVEDILATPGRNSKDKKAELDRAIEFLNEVLSDGPVTANEVKMQAEQVGIKKRTLERAKTKLGFRAFSNDGTWYWPQL